MTPKEIKEYVLTWHWAGKKHTFIIRALEKRGVKINRHDIQDIILKDAKAKA